MGSVVEMEGVQSSILTLYYDTVFHCFVTSFYNVTFL